MTDVERLMGITDLLNAALKLGLSDPRSQNFVQTAFFLSHKINQWLSLNAEQIQKDISEAIEVTKVF